MKRDPRWHVCAWADCGRIFRPDKPDQRYCSRECARRAEAKAREPTREEQIRAVMAAVEREIRRLLR